VYEQNIGQGVLVGGDTDIVATVILTIPLIIYMIATELTGSPKDRAAVMAAIRANTLLYGLRSLVGLACSVLARLSQLEGLSA